MKRLSPTLRAIVCLLLEYCMALPMLWLFSGPMPDTLRPLFLLTMLACGLLGILTRRLIPSPILQLILGLPLCAAGAVWLSITVAGRQEPLCFIIPAILAPLIYYRGHQHGQNEWNAILPVYAPAVLMTLTFLLMALIQYLNALEGFMPFLALAGTLSLIVSFYAMNHINRRNLADDQRAGGDGAAVSRRLSPQNIVLLGVIMAVGFLLTCTPWLFSLFRWVFHTIVRGIAWFFEMLFRFQTAPSGSAQGGSDMAGMVGDPTPRPFWDAFFKVFTYVVGVLSAIAFAVLIVLALRNGIRLLMEVLRKFLDQKGILMDRSTDFEDTHESLVQLRDLPKQYLDNLKNRLRRIPRWGELKDETERVRFLYSHSLRKAERYGYRHKTSRTARESLDEAASSLPQIQPVEDRLRDAYEQVRYGEETPPEGSADAIRRDAGL